MRRHFTVKTLQAAGLGDQLGTQFVRLCRLGTLLGLRYVHTPPTFPRSNVPGIFKRGMAKIRNHLGMRWRSDRIDPLARFLGIDR